MSARRVHVLSRVRGDISPGPVSFVFFLNHFHKSVSFASFLAPQVLHCCVLFEETLSGTVGLTIPKFHCALLIGMCDDIRCLSFNKNCLQLPNLNCFLRHIKAQSNMYTVLKF